MQIEYPSPSRLPQLRLLWKEAFGDSDAFLDGFYATGFSPDRCRCLTENERVAAALYWFDCLCGDEKTAYLYAVATHPDFRNRGLCRALLEDTHTLLKARGYAAAVLVPDGEPLGQMYGRFGYETCGGIRRFTALAGDIPGFVREVDVSTYAALRRQYLPPDGVIQEGPALDYLAGFAQFYAGKDFLLAACQEGKALRGLELLGNAGAAPGILRALGYSRGTFGVPGDAPFAMWLPLASHARKPGYFGLDLA